MRKITKDMLKHEKNPNLDQIRCVVKKIVRLHPGSFEDRTNEGERFGCGFYSLAKQVKTRIEHTNRGNTLARLRKPRKKHDSTSTSTSNPSDSYGCVNWQPAMPEGEDEESLAAKQAELKDIHSREGPSGSSRGHLDELMKLTFYLQRQDINSKLPIDDLKQKWPFLFLQRWLCLHFLQLTDIAAFARMTESIERKGDRIIRYMESLGGLAKKSVGEVLRELHVALDGGEAEDQVRAPAVALLVMA